MLGSPDGIPLEAGADACVSLCFADPACVAMNFDVRPTPFLSPLPICGRFEREYGKCFLKTEVPELLDSPSVNSGWASCVMVALSTQGSNSPLPHSPPQWEGTREGGVEAGLGPGRRPRTGARPGAGGHAGCGRARGLREGPSQRFSHMHRVRANG